MSEGVIVAIITGLFTLIGTVITVVVGMSKANKNIEIVQAVTNEKLDHLTEEVKKHNDFGQRIPILEVKLSNLEQKVEAIANEHN